MTILSRAVSKSRCLINHNLSTGIGCGVGVVLIASTVFILYQRQKKALKYARSYSFSQGNSLPPQTDSEMGVFPGVHHFSYNELERATNKFDSTSELGDGGLGTVYYGKLQDGRLVAVKRLYENNTKELSNSGMKLGS
ncbi:hypothetical protein SLEP1_g50574 [Rubroshorea leprosula]|uniref:Protein kinase domain-containing protein n=1 Tax=Rubroshorea leprosula TaxID=152421 RepID=A0AAV5M190_9ROSI|nr:hypothetical protein SLEP1_g50574 [Rubroshorea leprosula]